MLFQFAGKRHNLHVGKVSAADAQLALGLVELLLGRIKAGLLAVPPWADIVRFLAAGGMLPEPPAAKHSTLTLGQLRDAYLDAHRGSLADNTFGETVTRFQTPGRDVRGRVPAGRAGAGRPPAAHQAAGGHDRPDRPVPALTVKRDVTTPGVAWRWAVEGKLLAGPFPRAGGVRLRPRSCRT